MLAKQVHYGCAADTLTHVLMILVGLFWSNSACTVSADQHRCTTAGVLPSTENVKHVRTKCNAEHKTCSQDLTQQQWCRAFLLHPQATTSSSHYGMPHHATPCHTNRQQALVPTSLPPPPTSYSPLHPPPPSALPPPPPFPQKSHHPPPHPASQPVQLLCPNRLTSLMRSGCICATACCTRRYTAAASCFIASSLYPGMLVLAVLFPRYLLYLARPLFKTYALSLSQLR